MAADKKKKPNLKTDKDGKRRPRRWLRWTIYIGGSLFCLLLIFVLVFLPMMVNAGWFDGYIAEKIGKALGGNAEFEDVRFGLFSGVTLYGLTLDHPENGRRIISCEQIGLSYDLSSFLWSDSLKQINIDKLGKLLKELLAPSMLRRHTADKC